MIVLRWNCALNVRRRFGVSTFRGGAWATWVYPRRLWPLQYYRDKDCGASWGPPGFAPAQSLALLDKFHRPMRPCDDLDGIDLLGVQGSRVDAHASRGH